METAIFIKTWSGDIPWLKYCLGSIKLYASGFTEVVVAADQSCVNDVSFLVTDEKLISVQDWENGYIQQQWIKLCADKYTNADQILFVDSDCVFHTPFTPQSFIKDGKPVLMKTKYGNLEGAEAWKKITEDFVGFEVEYEYMRRLPWMYLSSSLSNFRMIFPNTESHLKGLQDRSFSEFNALGAYIERYEFDQYYITDTENWILPAVAEQFWSWGKFTDVILARIDNYLKGSVK